MSVKIMSAVWELDLPQNQKLVALCFADFADDSGFCFPSVERIAWKTGYGRRQTQALIQSLRKAGILEPVSHVSGGRGLATVHRVSPEKGAKLAPFSRDGGTRKRVRPWAESARPGAQKGALATAPQPSVTVKEPPGAVSSETFPEQHPMWVVLGGGPFGNVRFQRELEAWWDANPPQSSLPVSQHLEQFIQEHQRLRKKIPQGLFDTKRRIEEREQARHDSIQQRMAAAEAAARRYGVIS